MDVDTLSDQESVDSSSSDEGSEGEGCNSGVSDNRGATGMLEGPREGSSGPVWETTLISDDEEEEGDRSDGDMASAVASASKQASKFLEDSDSEEETGEGARTNLQTVFGDDSEEEEDDSSPVRAKRGLSSEGEDHEARPKRIRVDSEEGSDGEAEGSRRDASATREVIALDSDEEAPANKEVIGLDSDEEVAKGTGGVESPGNREVVDLDSGEETPTNREEIGAGSGNKTPGDRVVELDSDEETPVNKGGIDLVSGDEEEAPANKDAIELVSDDEGTSADREAVEVVSDDEDAPARKRAIELDSDEEETPSNKGAIELGSDEEETPANKGAIELGSDEEAPANKRAIGLDSDEESPGNKGEADSDGEIPGDEGALVISEGAEGGEGSGEQEEEGVLLQEEELGEEGGREEEGEGSDGELEDDKRMLDGMTDWDLMMARRKEAMARARRKRKRDGDLTVNDDHVMALIQQMREAAQEDRKLNIARKAATKKIQMLPVVMGHLKKADLQTTLVECGILSVLAEWLTPLPDHSLPHLKIRESILDILKVYPVPDSSILKSSKIGKAIMLLYRHPKEAKKNKEKAGRIINEWVRPIFGLASDFKSMTRDEREERDYANLSQEARRRISSGERRPSQDDETEMPQKPGDKGWIGRARVPMPSTKGYVVRPKWNTDQSEFTKRGSGKKPLDRYEKHLRKRKQEKMQSKTTHAVPISVEGRHMPL